MFTVNNGGRKRSRAAAVLIWLGTTMSVQGQALDGQTRQGAPKPLASYTPLDEESYGHALDLIFPSAPKITKGVLFVMRVRFLPASDPEAQILVTFFQSKPPSVTYTVADKQVFASAYSMAGSDGKPEIAKIARSITVRSKAIEVGSERVLGWQQDMFRSLGDSFPALRRETEDLYRGATVGLLLDGPSYEVRYAQGLEEFSGRFAQTAEGLPLAQWAESLRSEAESANAR
jgi:hypothetical protein